MGSAAAVTVGVASLPVYEIYKVGDEARWLPGLDLLGSLTGVPAAVIPHYDNREGGRHDTRFCYMGEQRLLELESLLPDDVGVLGFLDDLQAFFDLPSVPPSEGLEGARVGTGGIPTCFPPGRWRDYAGSFTEEFARLAPLAARLGFA